MVSLLFSSPGNHASFISLLAKAGPNSFQNKGKHSREDSLGRRVHP
jgi:hypothetical protein